MIESRRQAYLEAMGLDVWVMKPAPSLLDRLVLRPGEGGTLLLCSQPEDTAGRMAGDIARALEQDIVWAWPDPEGGEELPTLEQAIGQRLFTHVIIFGEALAQQVCRGSAPPVLGSARLLVTQELGELAVRGTAKHSLWKAMSASRLD